MLPGSRTPRPKSLRRSRSRHPIVPRIFTTETQLHGITGSHASTQTYGPYSCSPANVHSKHMWFHALSIDGAGGYFPDRVRHASGCVSTYNDGFRPTPVRIAGLQGTLRPPGTRFGDEITVQCKLADFSVSNV